MNIYWKTACAFGLLIVGFLGGWYVNGNRLEKQITAIHQAHAEEQSNLEGQVRLKEQTYRQAMQQQAEQFQTAVAASNKDIDKLKAELKNVQKQKPMPAHCSIDSDRLRLIKQIGDHANSRNATN